MTFGRASGTTRLSTLSSLPRERLSLRLVQRPSRVLRVQGHQLRQKRRQSLSGVAGTREWKRMRTGRGRRTTSWKV